MTAAIITLYTIGGVLELTAVALTYRDLRAKADVWRTFLTADDLATNPREAMIQAAARARGGTTWNQLQRLNQPIGAALDSNTLRWAGLCLTLGIVIGTVANILNT